jgi:hypothetical protein
VSSENFSYTPLPQTCDSTTADFVAMRWPVPDGCNLIHDNPEILS